MYMVMNNQLTLVNIDLISVYVSVYRLSIKDSLL